MERESSDCGRRPTAIGEMWPRARRRNEYDRFRARYRRDRKCCNFRHRAGANLKCRTHDTRMVHVSRCCVGVAIGHMQMRSECEQPTDDAEHRQRCDSSIESMSHPHDARSYTHAITSSPRTPCYPDSVTRTACPFSDRRKKLPAPRHTIPTPRRRHRRVCVVRVDVRVRVSPSHRQRTQRKRSSHRASVHDVRRASRGRRPCRVDSAASFRAARRAAQ